jgi:hypothetical protein
LRQHNNKNIERLEDIFTDIRPAAAKWATTTTPPPPSQRQSFNPNANGDIKRAVKKPGGGGGGGEVKAEKVLLFLPDSPAADYYDLKADDSVSSSLSSPAPWDVLSSLAPSSVAPWASPTERAPLGSRSTLAPWDNLATEAPWATGLSPVAPWDNFSAPPKESPPSVLAPKGSQLSQAPWRSVANGLIVQNNKVAYLKLYFLFKICCLVYLYSVFKLL